MSRTEEPLSTRDLASPEPATSRDAEERRDDAGARDLAADAPAETRVDDTVTDDRATATRPDPDDDRTAAAGVSDHDDDRDHDAAATAATTADTHDADPGDASLLAEEEGARFRGDWESIQAQFVDDPRRAVEEADGLVAKVMQQLAEGFAREREGLEGQWSRGEDVSTEDLRVALQRYRSFFQRLLSA